LSSRTTKQAFNSSADQGGGKRRGLPRAALDLLQHQGDAERDRRLGQVPAASRFIKLRGDVAPDRAFAVLRRQMPYQLAHVGQRPQLSSLWG
jgi:hypothetical protein